MKKQIFSVIGLAALMSSAALANATADLTPSASITNACTVTGNPLSFGAYDPIAGTAVDQTTTISVACTNGMTAPPITLGEGLHKATGSTAAAPLRQLNAGTGKNLTYQLYSDAEVTVWNNTTGVPVTTVDGSAHDITVYGEIAAGQHTAVAGDYSDTVVVTVTF